MKMLLAYIPYALLCAYVHAVAIPQMRGPIIYPSLMPPPKLALSIQTDTEHFGEIDGDLHFGKEGSLLLIPGRDIASFTAFAWLKWTGPTTSFIAPHIAPQEAFGTHTCETYLGPVSGSGNQTWPAAVQALTPEEGTTLNAVAFNLTCSAETTLSFGKGTRTFQAGEHLGVLASSDAGADIVLATTGTWTIEVAKPKATRHYTFIGGTSEMAVSQNVFSNQWGCSVIIGSIADGQMTLTNTTYYPDGCAEESSIASFISPTSIPSFPKGCRMGLWGTMVYANVIKNVGTIDYIGYGVKGWSKILTQDQIAQVISKDAAEMVRRGILSESDLHPTHTNATATASAKARTLAIPSTTHAHFPGPPPPIPDFEDE